MDDLISRQAAIDAINHICPVDTEYDCTLLDRVDVRCVLSDLPSVQPERKRGEWIKNEGRFGWYCSECKVDNFYAYAWNSETGKNDFQDSYCPNCGAKMKGTDDE